MTLYTLWGAFALALFVYLWLRARAKQKATRKANEGKPVAPICFGCGSPHGFCQCFGPLAPA